MDLSSFVPPREAARVPITRECSACVEPKELLDTTTIGSDVVCYDCAREMFVNATENESNYPPRWGDIVLQIAQFAPFIGADVVMNFLDKQAEYQTPWLNRVYCRHTDDDGNECGTFLGRGLALGQRKTGKKCDRCGKKTCRVCKELHSGSKPHDCQPKKQDDVPGLHRGKDYQRCPGCGENIELREGCNHITCEVCRSSFCYICGQPAEANSNHWSRLGGSQCPRYNQPGASNAMFEEDAGVDPLQMNPPEDVVALLGLRRNALAFQAGLEAPAFGFGPLEGNLDQMTPQEHEQLSLMQEIERVAERRAQLQELEQPAPPRRGFQAQARRLAGRVTLRDAVARLRRTPEAEESEEDEPLIPESDTRSEQAPPLPTNETMRAPEANPTIPRRPTHEVIDLTQTADQDGPMIRLPRGHRLIARPLRPTLSQNRRARPREDDTSSRIVQTQEDTFTPEFHRAQQRRTALRREAAVDRQPALHDVLPATTFDPANRMEDPPAAESLGRDRRRPANHPLDGRFEAPTVRRPIRTSSLRPPPGSLPPPRRLPRETQLPMPGQLPPPAPRPAPRVPSRMPNAQSIRQRSTDLTLTSLQQTPFEHPHAHRRPAHPGPTLHREPSLDRNFRFPLVRETHPRPALFDVHRDFAPNSFHHPFSPSRDGEESDQTQVQFGIMSPRGNTDTRTFR